MCKLHASCETNAFVAAYEAANGVGINPATEDVNTIHPFCLLVTNFCRKWCAIANAAVALHSTLDNNFGNGV